MFDTFVVKRLAVGDVESHVRLGGSGPPVLLLHGYPQTHAMWHKVAPALAQRFTVVVPDLRGYGDSAKPSSDAEHVNYSKRTMANDQVAVMRALGFERFRVCGHDRGGRVAYRMALDHDCVTQLAVLEIWQAWAKEVAGRGLDCGHFLPEEASTETFEALSAFFGGEKLLARKSGRLAGPVMNAT